MYPGWNLIESTQKVCNLGWFNAEFHQNLPPPSPTTKNGTRAQKMVIMLLLRSASQVGVSEWNPWLDIGRIYIYILYIGCWNLPCWLYYRPEDRISNFTSYWPTLAIYSLPLFALSSGGWVVFFFFRGGGAVWNLHEKTEWWRIASHIGRLKVSVGWVWSSRIPVTTWIIWVFPKIG